jgi:type II secretory pathway pseudopilin PulG
MPRFNKQKLSAFSLLELSIVLLIISSLVAMMTFSIQARTDAAKLYVTKERMQLIMDSIDRYVELYGHLPCHADRLPGINSSYGISLNPPSCADDATIYVGDVPVRSLGLDVQNITDGWGMRFDYVVIGFYTNPVYFLDSGFVNAIDSIQIYDASNHIISRDAGGTGKDVAYAIVSHGPNVLGAWDDKANIRLDKNGISGFEQQNTATPGGHARLYQAGVFIDDGKMFDDIVVYKTRWQLPTYINHD